MNIVIAKRIPIAPVTKYATPTLADIFFHFSSIRYEEICLAKEFGIPSKPMVVTVEKIAILVDTKP